MLGIIYAVSPEGVIGKDGTIPWRYPGDWRRFKRVTLGAAVIMGRVTFESIGKPLPGRRNIIVTSRTLEVAGIEQAKSVADAVALVRSDERRDGHNEHNGPNGHNGIERLEPQDAWFIGGARIYDEAMSYADRIDVTYVPDHVATEGAVFAPVIDEKVFLAGPLVPHEDEPSLTRRIYERKVRG